MPLYEYECESCGHRFELIQRFADPPAERCVSCGKDPVHKLLSAPAIHFKGTGWYVTDYANKKSDGSPKTDSGAPPAGGASQADSSSQADGSSKSDGASKTDGSAKSDAASSGSPASSDSSSAGGETKSAPAADNKVAEKK